MPEIAASPQLSLGPSATPLERVTGLHVLLADGNPGSRSAREQQLLADGHRVSVARTSFETIVKASCHLPDFILLDSALADIGVAETEDLLSTCPVTAHIPVVRLARGRVVPHRVRAELRRRSR